MYKTFAKKYRPIYLHIKYHIYHIITYMFLHIMFGMEFFTEQEPICF